MEEKRVIDFGLDNNSLSFAFSEASHRLVFSWEDFDGLKKEYFYKIAKILCIYVLTSKKFFVLKPIKAFNFKILIKFKV